MWQQKSTSWSPLKFLDSLKSLWGNLKSFPLSESSVNRSKIYLSFQNKYPIFLNDFMEIRLPSPCFSALSPEPLEIQTLRENLPTYSKPGPGWQEVVNCYWMTEWAKISRRWVVHGGSLAHVPPGNSQLCWGKSQEQWVGGCQHLSLCKRCGSKEGKQKWNKA